MVDIYIPKQGDICYMDFAPTKGDEQSGLRPAIVISKDSYNKFTHMAILCPITSNTKSFVTHYELKNQKKVKGFVLCEHIRNIDFSARKLSYVEKVDYNDLLEIVDIVNGFIDLND